MVHVDWGFVCGGVNFFIIRIACFKFSVYQGKWIGYWLCYLMKGGHLDSYGGCGSDCGLDVAIC